MTNLRSVGLLAATPLLALVTLQAPTATAALKPGTVKYFNGGLHRPGGVGRPTLPRVVIRNSGGGWRASTVKVEFKLDLYAEAGAFSKIIYIGATVHGVPRYEKTLYSSSTGGKRIRVTGGRFIAHSNGLGFPTRVAEDVCRRLGPTSPGTKTFVRTMRIQVRVTAIRHSSATKPFYRTVNYAIACERLPNRTPTAGDPSRDRPAFRVTSAHLRFFKENKRLCPKQISMQVRLYGNTTGKARIRVVRSDGRVVLTGDVDVKRVGSRYTGTYLKLDRARGPQNFRYRVIVTRGGQVTSRWTRLRVRCGTGGGTFTN